MSTDGRPNRSGPQEVERSDFERLGQPLDGAERRVAFASFEATEIGAMDPEHVGEPFLGEAALNTDLPETLSECPR